MELDMRALCALSHEGRKLLDPLAYKLQDRQSRQATIHWMAPHTKPIKTWQSWHWAKRI